MEVEKSQNQLQLWRWEPRRASHENQESWWCKFRVSRSIKTGWDQCPNSKDVRQREREKLLFHSAFLFNSDLQQIRWHHWGEQSTLFSLPIQILDSPGEGNGNPLQYSCLASYSLWVTRVRHDLVTKPPPIQILISSRNIFTDIVKIMFNQKSGHPVVQSSWHISLTLNKIVSETLKYYISSLDYR